MFEPGQNWKVAALKTSKCVCIFCMFHVKHMKIYKIMFHVKHKEGITMEKYMQIALQEAKKAEKKGDVPVGAVIVKDNKIIAKGHNKKEKRKMVTRHAEIEVIEKACKKLKTWHLEECEIYTTVEPCTMCYGAIEQARIKKIIYGTENEKFGYINKKNTKNKIELQSGILKKECCEMMKKFFLKKRG